MTSSNYKKHSISQKKQYSPKEMKEVIALLTKQVRLLERVKELMREIAEFKTPPAGTTIYYPYIYYPAPSYPSPWTSPFTYGTNSGSVVGKEVRYEVI